MAESEVARLREQIELECQALKLMTEGYAVVSNHAAIHRKYRSLGKHQDRLQSLVGEEEAMRIVYETYQEVVG